MKNKLILALHKVIANDGGIVAWDFPPRSYKKAVETIFKIFKKYGMKCEYTEADWPHFTLSYIQTLTNEQREKIKLVAPIFLSEAVTDKLILLSGINPPKDYLAWHLSLDGNKVKKLINWIDEETGGKQKHEFNPHVSLVMFDKKYRDTVEKIAPEIYNAIKSYKVKYTPDQLQFWKEKRIYEIEDAAFK